MSVLPRVAITMGDPAGIGPEVTVKALAEQAPWRWCVPVILGDAAVLAERARMLGLQLPLRVIETVREAASDPALYVVDDCQIDASRLRLGEVDPANGAAAVFYTRKAARLALRGEIDAIVSAPLNKEAMHRAGFDYEGATQIFAEEAKCQRYAMALLLGDFRLILLTNHMSLKDAIAKVKRERVLEKIMLAHEALVAMGLERPRIGVAALNPHAGEAGKFGREEIEEIIPAIEDARAAGVNAIGPVPGDTVFVRAKQGEFDMTVALYHDQGLGAIKLIGWGTVVTLLVGLPFIRTSTGHGTAFDIAPRLCADHTNMVEAIRVAADMARVGLAKKNRGGTIAHG